MTKVIVGAFWGDGIAGPWIRLQALRQPAFPNVEVNATNPGIFVMARAGCSAMFAVTRDGASRSMTVSHRCRPAEDHHRIRHPGARDRIGQFEFKQS